MIENWKPIEETKGKYRISDKGRVLHVSADRMLVPSIDKDGWPVVSLYVAGDDKTRVRCISRRVHKLVATAFLTKPSQNFVVIAIDGDKTNCDKANLLWTKRSGYLGRRSDKRSTNTRNSEPSGKETLATAP